MPAFVPSSARFAAIARAGASPGHAPTAAENCSRARHGRPRSLRSIQARLCGCSSPKVARQPLELHFASSVASPTCCGHNQTFDRYLKNHVSMQRELLTLAIVVATSASCTQSSGTSPFSKRLESARRAEVEQSTKDYLDRHMFPAMSSSMSGAMKTCLDKPNASTEKFVLVAEITPQGTTANVDYMPPTNTAECFATAFRTLRIAPPPEVIGSSTLPVFFEMTLTQ